MASHPQWEPRYVPAPQEDSRDCSTRHGSAQDQAGGWSEPVAATDQGTHNAAAQHAHADPGNMVTQGHWQYQGALLSQDDTMFFRPSDGSSNQPYQALPNQDAVPYNSEALRTGDGKSESTIGVEDRRPNAREPVSKVARSWLPEFFGVILAIGLHVAIFVILANFNGRHTSSFVGPINLNSLVATLSTISRIALGGVISEVVSQTKWSWMKRSRSGGVPLRDLEVFDQASRGPVGAISLLKKSLRRPYLLVSLLVALTSVAMGPFTQQAVLTVSCDYVDTGETASIPNLRTLGNLGPKFSNTSWSWGLVDSSTKSNMISSLLAPLGKESEVLPKCVTGNCTFPVLQDTDGSPFTHRSTGFCSRCLDISSSITYLAWNHTRVSSGFGPPEGNTTTLYQRWAIPSFMDAKGMTKVRDFELEILWSSPSSETPFLNITSRASAFDFSALPPSLPGLAEYQKASRQSLAQIVFLTLPDFEIESPIGKAVLDKSSASATICSLVPCLRTHNAVIDKDGRLNETTVSVEPLKEYNDMLHMPETNTTFDIHEPTGVVWPRSDAISVRTPCLVGNKVYTADSIASAPNPVTLLRWTEDAINKMPAQLKEMVDTNGLRSLTVNITAPRECLYAMDLMGWYKDLAHLLESYLQGSCHASRVDSLPSVSCIREEVSPEIRQRIGEDIFWLEGFARVRRRSTPELAEYMEEVARSMTRRFRMGTAEAWGKQYPGNEWRAESEDAVGQVLRTTTCFSVDWRWLTFSTGLTAITTGILIWTVVSGMLSRGVIWKSSVLPLIYYRERLEVVQGSKDLGVPEQEPLMSMGEMNTRAKGTKVVFRG